MGRKQVNHEQALGRFPEGTLERIEATREEGESLADFLRQAVERELKRREKHQK